MARPARDRGYGWFLLPGIVLSLLVIIVPLVMNIAISFTRWSGVGHPSFIGLTNYRRLIHDDNFWASFKHIIAMIVAMAVIPTMLGLIIATLLFDLVAKRFADGWASVFRSGFYLPQVLPVAVTGIVWGWLLTPDNGAVNALLHKVGLGSLAKNWLGDPKYALGSVMVVMIWVQIGYPIVMFMAGLQRIDPEINEAADLDGANYWQRFHAITVHLIKPEIYVVLLTTTISALKVFGQIFVLTRGGPGNSTLVPSYFAYQNFFQKADVGYGSAISSVLTLIVILLAVVFLLVQRRSELRSGIEL
jgi:raffinose/stachyose/melibiose transport system permease protein